MPPFSQRVPALLAAIAVMTAGNHANAQTQSGDEQDDSAEEIVVTATYLPRSTEEIAGTISVVTAEDIERQMANDLSDLTRYQPGLSMDTANRGGNQGFVIRGIGGNRVLTVIDGVRSSDIYSAGPASYGKDAFEMDDLKAVEVIRGPASVLYGSDAMGGAVLLRTKDASDYLIDGQSHYLSLRGSGASQNDQYKAGFTYATQLGDVDAVVQYTRREFSESDVRGEGRWNPQDGQTDAGLIRLSWQASPDQNLSLTADYRKENVDTVLENELSSSVQESLAYDTTRRRRLGLRHEWSVENILADSITTQLNYQETLGRQFTTQLRTSYAFVNPANPASFAGALANRESDFRFNQDTRSGSMLFIKNLSQAAAEHSVVYGVSHEVTETERPRDRCDTVVKTGQISCAIPSYPMAVPEVFPNKTFPDTRTSRTGLFIQDEIRLLDGRLSLIPGLRYERYRMKPLPDELFTSYAEVGELSGFNIGKVDESELSMNLGAVYSLTDSINLFAQYAEGFRPANFDEANQAFINAGHGYAIVPNTELEAETSQGYEAGMRAGFSNINLSLAVYSNHYDNFIESRMIGMSNGLSLFQSENIGKANIYGSEITLDWSINNRWSLRNSVAYSRGKDERNDQNLDSVEPLTLVTALGFQPMAGWQLEAVMTATGNKERVSAPDRVRGDAWQTLDLLANIDLGKLAMQLGVFNVFDEQYARWSSIKGLAADDTSNIANAQAPGTHARLAFRYEF